MRTKANLFGLLVGISDYIPPVSSLGGCVSDVLALEGYLLARCRSDQFNSERLRTLRNADATREAIIDGFQTHLSQARDGDTALFFFAGHGSQQPCAPEFWDREPDRLDETLVAYDSRMHGGRDLADKELAVLIEEVSANGAHVLVILDSCHSGSGTREPSTFRQRSVPPRLDTRPISTYLGYENSEGSARRRRVFSKGAAGWATCESGRHVLLAACRDYERAWESAESGRSRGLFTLALVQTLEESRAAPTYRSLFQGVRSRVLSRRYDQNPQLEATRGEDLELRFLGQALGDGRAPLTVALQASAWRVNLGAIHGMPEPRDGIRPRLALYHHGSLTEGAATALESGHAQVVGVAPTFSTVALDFDPGGAVAFDAALIESPLPMAYVAFHGDGVAIGRLREALQSNGPGGTPSHFVREDPARASLRVEATADRFEIFRASEDYRLTEIPRTLANAERTVVERLEHIAAWHHAATDLTNPASSILESDYEVAVLQDGVDVTAEGSLAYREEGGVWSRPGFRIRFVNRAGRPLYFSALVLSESFEISSLIPSSSLRLAPRQQGYANSGDPLYSFVSDRRTAGGVTETVDVIKVIVATSEFDARLLEKPELGVPAGARGPGESLVAPATLNLRMHRVARRGIARDPAKDDWRARNISVRTIRPRAWRELLRGPDTDLEFGVVVSGHSSVAGRARLSTEPQAGRALRSRLRPVVFDPESEGNTIVRFTSPSGCDPGLSVLELQLASDAAEIGLYNPVRVRTAIRLQPREHIVPFMPDGEFFLPLGRSLHADGCATIVIERLPWVLEDGIARILFQKVAATNASTGVGETIRGSSQFVERIALMEALALNRMLPSEWTPSAIADLLETGEALPWPPELSAASAESLDWPDRERLLRLYRRFELP